MPPYRHLDPAAEVARPAAQDPGDGPFVDRCVGQLRALGAPLWHAFEATAIACLEASWGASRAVPLHNPFGLKAKLDVDRWHRATFGRPLRWFRAPGHTLSGDRDEVYYAVFASDAQAWGYWLERHVGARPGAAPRARVYAAAGARFWARDPAWIDALIAGGYRGPKTKARPAGSIARHHSIVTRARALWAQGRLRLARDGVWGPASRAACAAFQRRAGLPATGLLDDATLAALAA